MPSSIRRVIGIFALVLTNFLTVATTASAGVDLDQCQNGVTTPPLQNLSKPCGQSNPDALPDPTWENGNINGSNSQYREGDGVPYRVIIDGLTDGLHSVQMEYDFTKGGKFAIDRLTRPSLTQMQNDCGTGGQAAFVNCVLFPGLSSAMPGQVSVVTATEPALPNGGNLVVAGKPRLLSGSITNPLNMTAGIPSGQAFAWGTFDANVVQVGDATGDSSRRFSFTFSVGTAVDATKPCNGNCKVVFSWTGHIASQIDWGAEMGAASISGSSFHMSAPKVDGGGGGQDRSLQLSAIIQTLELKKACVPSNDTGLFDLTMQGSGSPFTKNGATCAAPNDTTGMVSIEPGDIVISETGASGTNLLNYATTVSCEGGIVTSVTGDTTRSATVTVPDGGVVACTFLNTLRLGILEVKKSLDPISDTGKFNLFIKNSTGATTIASVSNQGNNGTTGNVSVLEGTYQVSETAGTNTSLNDYSSSIECKDQGGSGTTVAGPQSGPGPLNVPVAADSDVLCIITNQRKMGKLEVRKDLIPSEDEGRFDLYIKNTDGSSTLFTANNVGDNGTTLEQMVNTGTYQVGESAHTGTAAGDYTSGIECRAGNGAGSVVASSSNAGPLSVAVGHNDDIVCVITNTRKRGQIVVKKVTAPASDTTTSFTYQAEYDIDGFSLKNSDQSVSPMLLPGSYDIRENSLGGWDLTNVHCELTETGAGTSTFPANTTTQPITIGLESGDVVECTFTNTKQAKITLAKACAAGGDISASFDFTKTGNGGATPVTRTCGESAVVVGPTSASADFVNWTITEAAKPGWDLTNIVCSADAGRQIGNAVVDEDFDDGDDRAVVHLDAGDDITCTFTNRQRGSLTIVKNTNPPDSDVDFTFDPSDNLSASNFNLDTDADPGLPSSTTFNNLPANNATPYSVAEINVPNGWGLWTIACSDTHADDGDKNTTRESVVTFTGGNANTGFQLGDTTVNVTISPGEHLTCTFTNVKLGTIIVEKQTLPDGDPTTFTYTSNDIPGFPGVAVVDNILADGESFTVDNLFPGTYHVSELVPTDWDVSNISCNDANSTGSVNDREATFRVEVDETVTCVFENMKRGHIMVDKVTIPPGAPDVFHFDAQGGTNPAYQDFSLRDQDPPNNQSLRPGHYSVTELPHEGFDLTGIQCQSDMTDDVTYGDRTANIELEPGETVTCVFTNTRRPLLVLTKIARFGEERFPFDLNDGQTSTTIHVRTAKPYYEDGVQIGTIGEGTFYLSPGSEYDLTENLSELPQWYMNNVTCVFRDGEADGSFQEFPFFGGQPLVVNDLLNPAFPRNTDIPTVHLEDIVSGGPLEHLDVIACTYTNTEDALMPLVKLLNGCEPNANGNGNKCGAGDYPGSTFNLYALNFGPLNDPMLTGATMMMPLALPAPPALTDPPFPGGYLATTTAPPSQDLPGPTGVPFAVCEMGAPEGWGAYDWRVEITPYGSNKPQTIINYAPYIPGQLWQDPYATLYNPDYFFGPNLDYNNRCINVVIPLGTDTFEIFANNISQGGRMTGGGSVFTADGKRVTHGFELHCDKNDKPNNLEINWDGGNKFHLENLTYANCTDDPDIDSPAPPSAGFDTHQGRGTGRFNGQPATAEWIFTDAGEPGLNDKVVYLKVKLGNGNGNGNAVLLVTNANLNKGNHQAHK